MLFAYERPLCAGGNRTFPQGQFLTLTDIDCRSATQATWFRARLACWRRRTKSLSLAESESRFVTASGSISLFGKGDGENARPLPCRTTRTRSSLLPQLSHSGPSSNGCFSQPAISGTPVTSSGTPPLLPPKSEPSCRHGLQKPVPSNRCLRYGRSQLPVASSNLMK